MCILLRCLVELRTLVLTRVHELGVHAMPREILSATRSLTSADAGSGTCDSCRRQGVRERRHGVVAWAEGGLGCRWRRGEVEVMGGLWEKEGWRDEVRAGRLLLLSEDLGPLLRNGG